MRALFDVNDLIAPLDTDDVGHAVAASWFAAHLEHGSCGLGSVRMETIPAADAKTNFCALLDKAQGAPVTISKNGRAVAVVMSVAAFEEQQRLNLDLLRQEVPGWRAASNLLAGAGEPAPAAQITRFVEQMPLGRTEKESITDALFGTCYKSAHPRADQPLKRTDRS